jgi:tRNA(Leu) C34 or U34 (ribose-2'-O)-methylase TrmL
MAHSTGVPERIGKSDQKQNVRAPSEHHSPALNTSAQAFIAL